MIYTSYAKIARTEHLSDTSLWASSSSLSSLFTFKVGAVTFCSAASHDRSTIDRVVVTVMALDAVAARCPARSMRSLLHKSVALFNALMSVGTSNPTLRQKRWNKLASSMVVAQRSGLPDKTTGRRTSWLDTEWWGKIERGMYRAENRNTRCLFNILKEDRERWFKVVGCSRRDVNNGCFLNEIFSNINQDFTATMILYSKHSAKTY